MTLGESTSSKSSDSPEARRYNRIQRWLGIADFVVGSAFLVVLLVTVGRVVARSGFAARIPELHARRLFVFVLPALDQQSAGPGSRLLWIPVGAKVSALHAKIALVAVG